MSLDPGCILIRTKPPKQKQNDFLIRYANNITSQSGEDGILTEILSRIDACDASSNPHQASMQPDRWCVEFGCWDGKHLCNTANLIENHNFKAILIEADANKYKQVLANYRDAIRSKQVVALNELVGFNDSSHSSLHEMYPKHYNITLQTSTTPAAQGRDFDTIIDSLNLSIKHHTFDLMVIDIDGNDYHVFDSITKYRSKVVVIEFNPTIPNNIIYIQSRDMNVQCGSSLLAIIELAKRKGYELVCTTTYNAIFVDQLYYQHVFEKEIGDNSIYKMHDTPMETQMFQLYNGTIRIAGCKKLLWHRVGMNEEKMQLLPLEKRRFPFAPGKEELKKQSSKGTPRRNRKEPLKENTQKTQHTMRARRLARAVSTSALLLKATAFVAFGFVIGRVYQTRQQR